jgi:hypothetical protein
MRGTNLDPAVALYRREKRRRARRTNPDWREAVRAFQRTQDETESRRRDGRPRKEKKSA